jgi:thiol-disulfide isomerase/thioredoxin/tetratricopeptide (TPR) repeat protein
MLRTVIALAFPVLLVFPALGQSIPTLLHDGRAAYVDGRYAEALGYFDRALAAAPDDAEAHFGRARVLHVWHLYPEALEAYRAALAIDPENVDIRANYASALVWGGILKGDRRWVEASLSEAMVVLPADPARVSGYDVLRQASGEMAGVDRIAVLEQLQAERPHAVTRAQLTDARLQVARRSRDSVAVAGIEDEIRNRLLAFDAGRASSGELYEAAVGYGLLDEHEHIDPLLERLDAMPGGAPLAQPVRYWHRAMQDMIEAQRSGDPRLRLEASRRWQPYFLPSWDAGPDLARAAQGRLAGDLRAVADVIVREGGTLSEAMVDSIVTLGTRQARTDTWGRGNAYVNITAFLVRHDLELERAVALAAEGLAAVESREPGMIYPGSTAAEVENAYEGTGASLRRFNGLALAGLGRHAEAEPHLRAAAAQAPTAFNLAALGEWLAGQGREEEAVDVLLDALAVGFGQSAAREAEIRSIVERLFEDEPDLLAAEIERRGQLRQEERDRKLVEDRLNLPAPAFSLADLDGRRWALDDLAGRVVLLHFWATWCGPCVAQLPYYQQLVDEYGATEDVVLLAVSIDDNLEALQSWFVDEEYTFTVLHDDGARLDYGVTGTPTTFYIDGEGRIQYQTTGFSGAESFFRTTRLRLNALR